MQSSVVIGWDPWKILALIGFAQTVFYGVAGAVVVAARALELVAVSWRVLFAPAALSAAALAGEPRGMVAVLAFALAYAALAPLLAFSVRRPRACWDYAVTVPVVHAAVSFVLAGGGGGSGVAGGWLPRPLADVWPAWIFHAACAAVLAVVSEVLVRSIP